MAEGTNFDFLFKIILIGDSCVGKSSLLSRFVRNEYNPRITGTIGIDFSVKSLSIDARTIKAQIWDTPGRERFRPIIPSYYRGVAGALLVYDVTDQSSYANVAHWLKDLRGGTNDDIPIMLVGNKSDLKHRRVVPITRAETFAIQNNLLFTETSALEDLNIESAFQTLLAEIYHGVSGKSLVQPQESLVVPANRDAFHPPLIMQQSICDSIVSGNFIDAKIFAYSRHSRKSGKAHAPRALFVNTHLLANTCGYFRSTFDLTDGVVTSLAGGLPPGFDTAHDVEGDVLDNDYLDSAGGRIDDDQLSGEAPAQTLKERTVKAYLVKYTSYRTLRAIIWYIYTGDVFFSPADSPGFPIAPVESVYRFAEEHGMGHLQSLAFRRISETIKGMDESSLIQAAFSPSASRYPQIRDIYIQRLRYFLARGPNEDFRKQLSRYFAGELPRSSNLLTSLFQAVTERTAVSDPPAVDGSLGAIQRVSRPWPVQTRDAIRTSLDHGAFEDVHIAAANSPESAEGPMYFAKAVNERAISTISQLCLSGSSSRGGAEISLSTWRAIAYYLYTDSINFKFPGSPDAKISPVHDPSDVEFRGYQCSPREVLQISRKLDNGDELVDLAIEQIVSGLTAENVVEEMFWNSPAPEEILKRGAEIVRKNRDNPKIRSQLHKMLEEGASGNNVANDAAFYACFTELLRGVGSL